MRRLAVLALAVALCALPASVGSAGGDPSGGAVVAKAKKKCSKKKRSGTASKKRRHCRRPGSQSGGAPGAGAKEDPCPNTASSPGRVAARESEYQIVLSRPTLGCGTSIVEQDNLGEDPHDLVLNKQGSDATHYFPELGPGGVAKRTLDLGRGTWTLYCSLPGHLEAGMRVNLEVQ